MIALKAAPPATMPPRVVKMPVTRSMELPTLLTAPSICATPSLTAVVPFCMAATRPSALPSRVKLDLVSLSAIGHPFPCGSVCSGKRSPTAVHHKVEFLRRDLRPCLTDLALHRRQCLLVGEQAGDGHHVDALDRVAFHPDTSPDHQTVQPRIEGDEGMLQALLLPLQDLIGNALLQRAGSALQLLPARAGDYPVLRRQLFRPEIEQANRLAGDVDHCFQVIRSSVFHLQIRVEVALFDIVIVPDSR